MTTYEFGGESFRNEREYADAVISAWFQSNDPLVNVTQELAHPDAEIAELRAVWKTDPAINDQVFRDAIFRLIDKK